MPFDLDNLKLRVVSAAIIAPIAVFAVYCGGWIYTFVAGAFAFGGLYEWLRLVEPRIGRNIAVFALAALAAIMVIGTWQTPFLGVVATIAFTVVLFFLAREHKEQAGWIALGIPYMAGFGLAMLYLRAAPDVGQEQIYYLFAAVWSTDIGAYAAGRLIGGPKLCPSISPNKTWAGLIGGMILAAVFAYGIAMAFGARRPAIAIGLAIALTCVSQLGDLFESWIKRRAGVKESGNSIPGHGGVLDRIDGLVFGAVFFALFQITVGQDLEWW